MHIVSSRGCTCSSRLSFARCGWWRWRAGLPCLPGRTWRWWLFHGTWCSGSCSCAVPFACSALLRARSMLGVLRRVWGCRSGIEGAWCDFLSDSLMNSKDTASHKRCVFKRAHLAQPLPSASIWAISSGVDSLFKYLLRWGYRPNYWTTLLWSWANLRFLESQSRTPPFS